MRLVVLGFLIFVVFVASKIFWPIPNGMDTVKLERDITRYGLRFTGEWSDEEKANVVAAAQNVGKAMVRAVGMNISSAEMFRCFYNTSENNPMVFEKYLNDPRTLGAEVFTTRYIRVYGTYKNAKDANKKTERLFVHEFGHTFEDRIYEILNIKLPRRILHWTQINNYYFPMRGRGDSVLNGFAGGMDIWQFDLLCDPAEEFADMFVGWTYSMWEDSPGGCARENFMKIYMGSWISIGCPKTVR